VFGFEERPVVAAHGVELGASLAAANLVVDEGVAGLVWAAMAGAVQVCGAELQKLSAIQHRNSRTHRGSQNV
jgi:hypothetical protein